ncbi:MAG: hypothetical protein ACRDSK_28385 [Actinophytocola sp.]|uniref:hypothetical protein n=1 Tax=Actinophytocola sp. TaxID=1872138 RepID=UPI003D6A86BF
MPGLTVPSPAIVLLRRAVAVAGFLFGLGLLALLGAGQAGADERPAENKPADADAPTSGLTGPVLGLVDGVAAPVARVAGPAVAPAVAPVVEITEPVVEPVVRPVTEAVAPVVEPVVRPLTEAMAPVVRPVLAPVTPVLDSVVHTVAPVAEPLTGPLLRAADPMLAPVAASVGADGAVSDLSSDVSGPRTAPGPRPKAPSARDVPAAVSVDPVVDGSTGTPWSDDVTTSPPVATAGAQPAGPGRPGDRSGYPLGTDVVPGGGAAGGFGGQHGADGTVSSPGTSSGADGPGDRAPPGGDVALSWLAFEDRDHPS